MHSSPPEAASAGKDVEKEARDRVAELKAFHSHLASYIIVHTFLVGIYLVTGADHFWPIYPLFGWGIGLVSHAAATFGMFGMFDKSWEERKVREIVLQKEHGLSANQVRTLLKQEMAAERTLLPSADELRRIDQRLQNLEAIVTSKDWDELPSHSEELRLDADPDLFRTEAATANNAEAANNAANDAKAAIDTKVISDAEAKKNVDVKSRSADEAARLARRVR